MPFGQTKIRPTSNKSSIAKNAQPTMNNKFSDLSQLAAINFKLAKVGKSFIPSVPVNYTCPKQQKPGKSLIPRYMVNNPKKVENGKPSLLSHVKKINHVNMKKDKTLALVKHRKSYIPRRVAKNVETLSLSCNIQEKSQPTTITLFGKFGKSKIPVLTSAISTKKTKKTKKANVATRTSSHSRTCAICSPAKKENARVSRLNANHDNQVRVEIKEIKTIKTQTQVLTFNIIKNDDVPSRIPTPTSFKKSLIPVRSLTNSLFKKRVSPMQPSILTSVSSVKQDELESISTVTSNNKYQIIAQNFNKKTNSFVCFSKYTQLQKSVNKPGASITISHSQIEVSTTTSFIKPEHSSISLLYKAEKDLSGNRHQIEGNNNEDESSSLFDNVIKSIVRFSKNLFSKML